MRDFAIGLCGCANGLTASAFLMIVLATTVGPYVPAVRPDVDAAAGAASVALAIGLSSIAVAVAPRAWRWIALTCLAGAQFLVALSALPYLF